MIFTTLNLQVAQAQMSCRALFGDHASFGQSQKLVESHPQVPALLRSFGITPEMGQNLMAWAKVNGMQIFIRLRNPQSLKYQNSPSGLLSFVAKGTDVPFKTGAEGLFIYSDLDLFAVFILRPNQTPELYPLGSGQNLPHQQHYRMRIAELNSVISSTREGLVMHGSQIEHLDSMNSNSQNHEFDTAHVANTIQFEHIVMIPHVHFV